MHGERRERERRRKVSVNIGQQHLPKPPQLTYTIRLDQQNYNFSLPRLIPTPTGGKVPTAAENLSVPESKKNIFSLFKG